MINIVLVEPEIPQNTGNIARSCACSGAALHLVRPFGFEISDKTVKRAGLDYWDKVNITIYDSLDDFFAKTMGGKYYFLSTKAKKLYTEIEYEENAFLLFGKESKGLEEKLIFENYDNAVRIPMSKTLRSLNLSNAVAIVLFEAMRQHNFFDNY
jgi:tRNA (cytidine/uridine-2'-O-)-methyltransferase